jgi:hypothetical protein
LKTPAQGERGAVTGRHTISFPVEHNIVPGWLPPRLCGHWQLATGQPACSIASDGTSAEDRRLKRDHVTDRTRKSAEYAYEVGHKKRKAKRRPRVSRAVSKVLKREPRRSASRVALLRQARTAASRRTAAQRSASARKAMRTKGAAGRSAAKKAARTRARG